MPTIVISGFFDLLHAPGESKTYQSHRLSIHIFEYDVELFDKQKNKTFQCHYGDLMITPPNTPIAYKSSAPGKHICFHFSYESAEIMNYFIDSLKFISLADKYLKIKEECLHIIENFHSGQKWKMHAAASQLHSLICHFNELSEEKKELNSTEKSDKAVREVIVYLQNNLQENDQITDLAERVQLDKNYLAKKFKKKYGKTILKYRTELRLERACHLLKNTDYPLKFIAFNLGFSDIQHFHHAFKKMFNRTPIEYRKGL